MTQNQEKFGHGDISTIKADGVKSFEGFVEAVDVTISNVSVKFKPPQRTPFHKSKTAPASKLVLDAVSATAKAGTLTAIIGASGSGKTTLLNLISHRVPSSKLDVTGDVFYNGSQHLQSVRSAYVMQNDVLLPTLTVRETLRYSADLRLPSPATDQERKSIVEKVILELGLKECADTRIGNSARKGCSGGEKRRTSVGVQLLSNPSVLFCDEVTTGLDSFSAFQVVQRLKQLAQSGRTVILSLHAPRSEIWALFDNVIVLSRGATMYSGPAAEAIPYFDRCGFAIPPYRNPAEFLIDIAALDTRTADLEQASRKRVEGLRDAWKMETASVSSSPQQKAATPTAVASLKDSKRTDAASVGFLRQLDILTRRTIKVTYRDPMGIAASLFEATALAVITGWIFLGLGRDLAGIRSREGALYIAASIQGYLVLLFETFRLTSDIELFDRERQEGVVSVPAFIISRRLARLFLEDLAVPTIFSLIFYFMCGFRTDAATFFIFYVFMILDQYIAVTLASVCIGVSRSFAGASLVANLSYTVQALACGFFVQAQQIPIYVRWIKWTAYNFYLFSGLATNEFIGVDGGEFGQFYACPSGDPTDPGCAQYTGTFIAASLGFPSNWIWRPILIASSFALFFFLLSGFILQFNRIEVKVASARKPEPESPNYIEKVTSSSTEQVRRVAVDLQNYAMSVNTRHLTKRSMKKVILRDVNASFETASLNVVMGPSGSGKTSLLQSIAQRLDGSIGSTYETSGSILLNGAIPSSDVLKSIASFVTQDDAALMEELTGRETLRYAARLRLPASMSSSEKNQRAEAVLMKLGLKDAADNIIGSDLKKGISGGEKRRTSVAIQILTDPKVLLLDEPLSGLDVFTAQSVIEVLLSLAAEGRNIIMTVHQASSEMFQHFNTILLLARGGHQTYFGKASGMLSYFSALGHECPKTTNPSDFVLDLITVDLQEENKEAASRETVQRIIDAWQEQHTASGTLQRSVSTVATAAELSSLQRRMSPFRVTFPIVLRRSFLQVIRNPEILTARTTQVISIGGIFALFFAPLQHNYESVQSRMGFVAEYGALTFVGMLCNLAVYPNARSLFYREYADNCYSVSTFLLTYTLLEVPFTAISSLVFGAFVYGVNLQRTAAFTFISMFNCFALVSVGESIGIIFCTLLKSHVGFGVQVMSVTLSIGQIMGGVFSLNIPSFLQAWNHLSPVKYVTANVALYAMQNQEFTCTAEQQVNGVCPLATGQDVLQLYNLVKNPGVNLAAVAACVVVYRLIAFVILWLACARWDWSKLSFWKRRPKSADEGVSHEVTND